MIAMGTLHLQSVICPDVSCQSAAEKTTPNLPDTQTNGQGERRRADGLLACPRIGTLGGARLGACRDDPGRDSETQRRGDGVHGGNVTLDHGDPRPHGVDHPIKSTLHLCCPLFPPQLRVRSGRMASCRNPESWGRGVQGCRSWEMRISNLGGFRRAWS